MGKNRSFRFVDNDLNQELIGLLKKSTVDHSIDKDGVVRYSTADEERVENDLICSIRDKVFPSWKIITCPSDWTASYKEYMSRHGIPFWEELSDGALWFLIPRKYRPHSWKLDGPTKNGRLATGAKNGADDGRP
jgi:hypothetical protein